VSNPSICAAPCTSQWLSFVEFGAVLLRIGKIEFGQGIVVALALIAAEELDIAPGRVKVLAGDTASTPNEGFTAGSASISISGDAVRLAASGARNLLERTFSRRYDVSVARVVDGTLSSHDGAYCATYWDLLTETDLDQPILDHARPKVPADYTLVGREGGGPNLVAQVSGAAFIHDLDFPEMLHARVIRPPDLLRRFEGELSVAQLPEDAIVVRDGGFIGVIASSEQQAIEAAENLQSQIRCPVPDAPDRDPSLELARIADAGPVNDDVLKTDADTLVVDITASRRYLAHASIGLSCAIALWRDGNLTVWTHSQGVFPLRGALAALLAMDESCIRVIHASGAGCYGHNGADDAAADAALLARAVPGRHLRVQWTRAQELASAPLGAAMRTRIVATVRNGRLVTMRNHVTSTPHARRPGFGGGVNLLAGYLRSDRVVDPIVEPPASAGGGAERNIVPGYDIGIVRTSSRIIDIEGLRTSALRSLGAHLNVTAIEAAMDEAALRAAADPAVFRLRHLSDTRARAVVERVVQMAAWPRDVPCGIGYARYKNTAAYCAVVAQISLGDTIRVERVWCAVDVGLAIDPVGVISQIEGGIIQSISWTLKEAVPFEGRCTAIVGWEDYPILGFDEIPEIATEILGASDKPTLGVGEASCGPAAAAVSNAVAAALGQRVLDLPITRDRVIEAIG
jgi:nicotinate dehydrogenase subunit B